MTDTLAPPVDIDGRRPDVEAWLDSHHVKWRFDPALPLDQVNQAASIANQARLEALDTDVVDRYATDMAAGDQFPPLLAHKRGRAKLVLLGGNHRYVAARQAGHTTHPAYIVEAEPETALVLTYEDNRRHGLPPSTAERIVQAIHLIDTGHSQDIAAAIVGVPAPVISKERSIRRVARRAAELDVAGFDKLAKDARYQLSIIRSDPVFTEVARLAVAARLTVTEVKDVVRRVNTARSDVDALNLVSLEAEERRGTIQRSAGGRAKVERTPRVRVLQAATQIRMLGPADIAASCPTADARKELKAEIRRLGEHLAQIVQAL